MSFEPEQFLPIVEQAFAEVKKLPGDQPDGVFQLVAPLLNNQELWQAVDTASDSPALKKLRELLFAILRIAQVDANGQLPLTFAPLHQKLARGIKNALTAVKKRDLQYLRPKNQINPFGVVESRIETIQARRAQLRMTIDNSQTPDGLSLYPDLEMVQDDMVRDGRLGLHDERAEEWEALKERALSDLKRIQAELPPHEAGEKLTLLEQQYLGILSGLTVYYLRLGQLVGRADFLEQALDELDQYYFYLFERAKNNLSPQELKNNLNKDRLKDVTDMAFLGAVSIFDLNLLARWRVWKKVRQLRNDVLPVVERYEAA